MSAADVKLTEAVKKHGNDWVAVAAMVPGRTNNQCSQRWVHTLDRANGKNMGNWSPKEDAKLTEVVKKHGNQWVAGAAMVSTRTNHQCRKRWVGPLDPANGKKLGNI